MKILRVGDMHVKPSNLAESESLMEFILRKSKEHSVDRLEFLGDLTDTHSIVRLEVIEFLDKWFYELSVQQNTFETIVIAGNHDMTGSYTNEYTSLNPFIYLENAHFKIVHEPYIKGVYGYLPYVHDNDLFVSEANKMIHKGVRVLVSHPNFKGAVYDNGTPISNAVDPDLLNSGFLHLIGGHVHSALEYGRVWYIGTPRWLTKSCSNKSKGIWLCNHDDSGQMVSKEFISTENVCTPIYTVEWKQDEEKPIIPPNAKVYLELIGSSDWVSEQKKDFKGSVSLSSKITDSKTKNKQRKSGKSLMEFLEKHYEGDPDKRKKLIQYLGDLKLV